MTGLNALNLALLLVVSCAAARAHDPLDLTAQARLLPEGLELRLTLASSTASRLLAEGQPAAAISPERFAQLHATLQLRAPNFLTVTAGGKTLAPKSVATELSPDGDVKILLQFPPSAARSFHFDAVLLKTLPATGYTVFLLVRSADDTQATHERMTLEKPACEIAAFAP